MLQRAARISRALTIAPYLDVEMYRCERPRVISAELVSSPIMKQSSCVNTTYPGISNKNLGVIKAHNHPTAVGSRMQQTVQRACVVYPVSRIRRIRRIAFVHMHMTDDRRAEPGWMQMCAFRIR